MLQACKSILLVGLLGIVALGLAFAQAKKSDTSRPAAKAAELAAAERAVTKLEHEWFADQIALDWEKLTRMIAKDFVLTESDGRLGNRDSMLAGYKEEAASTTALSMTLLVSHAVASGVVIATGLDDISLKDKGGRIRHRYERFTDTWVLRDGRWQCVAEQLTLARP